jgi:hypothetical protein
MKRLIDTIILYFIGSIFIFSSLMKMMDIIGTSLIIQEYFNIVNIHLNRNLLSFFSYSLSVVEFLAGFFLLIRVRRYIWIYVILVFLIFFTLLTLYLVLFNPISDCGCFGEIIKLSNLQTFLKNILLLLGVIYLILFNNKNSNLFKNRRGLKDDLVLTLCFIAIFFASYPLIVKGQPIADFADFKPGTNLKSDISNNSSQIETRLIYSKGGELFEFTIDNLPDSTYTFIDSKSFFTDKFQSDFINFSILDGEGEVITDRILENNRVVIFTVPNLLDFDVLLMDKVSSLGDSLISRGINSFVLTGSSYRNYDRDFILDKLYPLPVYHSDYKTVISLSRPKIGVVYINDGLIIEKWSLNSIKDNLLKDIYYSDPEIILTKREIWSNLFIQFLFLGIVVLLVVCKVLLKVYDSKYEYREGCIIKKV